jgi:putative ABC transport system permease protein
MFQDVRFGLRILLKNPGFTLIAILTLALGIGANTAIFSVVNAVLLRPLPYQNADKLAMFYFTNTKSEEEEWFVSPAAYEDLRAQDSVFTDVAAWANDTWPANVTGNGEPERLQGFRVSANFFDVLGVAAAQGRTFPADAEPADNTRLVVISHELWQRRFNGDPGVIGSPILLNGAAYDVIGVLPPGFRFVLKTDVWTSFDPKAPGNRNIALHKVFRLKPDVSTEQARAEIERLLLPHVNNPASDLRGNLKPLQMILMGEDVRLLLLMLFAAVGFVLLIACANVANLLLARASVRRRELAIRAALGAGRLRVARQLLVESAMLAVIGGACGLLLAKWCIGFLVGGLPPDVVAKNSNVAMLELDGWALGFTLALALLTTVIFGLVPALQASKVNLNEVLNEGGRSRADGRRRNRLRSLLVMSEIAMAMVLSIGGGLMIKSLWRLNNVDRGFETTGVLTAKIDPSGDKYREPHQVVAFYEQLLERVSAIPGVQHAGITNGFLDRLWRVAVDEHPPVPRDQRPTASRHPVSPDYFRAMGIPLRAGRLFTDRDVQGALPVVIIDETLARRHFANEDPTGKHLRFEDVSREIVGVVAATRAWKPFTAGDVAAPRVYLPYQQEGPWPTMALIVRAQSGDPANLIPAIRSELAAIDKDLPIHSFKPLEKSVDELSADRRFSTMLLAAFAAVAALLATVGVYGVVSYTVTQRTHEIGIRMALGAQAASVVSLVMRQGAKLAAAGVSMGLAASFGLTRMMESLLFGVSALDSTTFALTTVFLVSVALVACYLPARRATKVDPMVALRHQ